MSARSAARHAIGVAILGPDRAVEASRCVLCGVSRFPTAGPRKAVFGAGFSDWTLCDDPNAPDICKGCAAIVSGRPGRQPPPLRMRSCAVIDGALVLLSFEQMWRLLVEPSAATVISWATSGQKHHALYAEISTPDRLAIGSDEGCIVIHRADLQPVASAVLALRAGDDPKKPWCTRDEILSGRYRPQSIVRAPAVWQRAEAVIAPRRGSLLLALLVAHAPVEPATSLGSADMPDPVDVQAAQILMLIAKDSAFRATNGKQFWGGVFERRIRRHLGRPLAEIVSRLATDLQVSAISNALHEAHMQIAALSEPQQMILASRLKARTTLIIGLAYQAQRDNAALLTKRSTHDKGVSS